MSHLNRRQMITGAAAVGVATLLPRRVIGQANAFGPERHGMSIFGDLKYAEGFQHFDYVNPAAPKGGEISLQTTTAGGNQNFQTFDTLNMYSAKGSGAAGMSLTFDTLMASSGDEPDSMYGLVAKTVSVTADGLVYRFRLRPEARFHDGSQVTADDVAFSITTLKTRAYPIYRVILRDVEKAEAPSPDLVEVTFKAGRSRELPMMVAGLPIFSKKYYDTKDFDAGTLEPPLGSGQYKVAKVDVGRSITYQRDPNYWAKDLNVSVGQGNFERIRYEYFRDREAGFQGFTGGAYNFRQEYTSLIWATRYDFPAFKDGRVKREELPDQTPSGMQGWWINTRRAKFKDPRVREAVGLCFDFEWSNKNLMYDAYARTASFFENSTLKAEGKPSPDELKLLEPLRGQIPDEVFGDPYVPSVTDGSGQDRTVLRKAQQLLTEAGCKRDAKGQLTLASGEALTIEFIEDEPTLNRHLQGYVKNLSALGIQASIRVVDPTQYQRRVEEFDFDLVSRRYSTGETPGESLKAMFGSENAQTRATRNLSGIENKVVDALIQKAIEAATRPEAVTAVRALDRVLRAGRYWVPAWYSAKHRIAYWDVFARPAQQPRYVSPLTGWALSAWWYDAEKAKKIGL